MRPEKLADGPCHCALFDTSHVTLLPDVLPSAIGRRFLILNDKDRVFNIDLICDD